MGYIKHDTVIVTSWDDEGMNKAYKKAIEIFSEKFEGAKLISPIISGVVNSQYSFFIAPDGSKEGWEASDLASNARTTFMDWLQENYDEIYCEYIHIRFGGDDSHQNIVRSHDTDINEEEE